MTEANRTEDLRSRFERYVRRSWHPSWRKNLKEKNENGVYLSMDLQNAWHNWRAGFIAGKRAKL